MRACEICGRGYKRSFSRSHSNQATIRKLQINLQWTKLAGRRIRACSKCIKTQDKRLAVAA
ncbi:MAG: 50S ribosomal protein L28 [Candidatus Doudnabacteria bacterium]|nr:50S ribosomal protein L28 [Candidatus Doudnabacteria bacterium]